MNNRIYIMIIKANGGNEMIFSFDSEEAAAAAMLHTYVDRSKINPIPVVKFSDTNITFADLSSINIGYVDKYKSDDEETSYQKFLKDYDDVVKKSKCLEKFFTPVYTDTPTTIPTINPKIVRFDTIDVWNSKENVDRFFKTHTYENGWKDLKLGNIIRIADGAYNQDWVIAGFDCEEASDDTPGGIVLIPYRTSLCRNVWSTCNHIIDEYENSALHYFINSTMLKSLNKVLGGHIVPRSKGEDGHCYLTILSSIDLGLAEDKDGKHKKLDLFNYIDFNHFIISNEEIWLSDKEVLMEGKDPKPLAMCTHGGKIIEMRPLESLGVFPMIYLR